MKYFLLLLLLLPGIGKAQSSDELKTEIKEVTVFLNGAQINRLGNQSVKSGKSLLTIKGLSPHIDEKSIQVKATGDFTILSVNHKLNYLDRVGKDAKIDSLLKAIKALELEISSRNNRLEILGEKESVLDENKKLGSQTTVASLTQIKQAIEFYDRELTAIKVEERRVNQALDELKEDKQHIQDELNNLRNSTSLPTSEIEIHTQANSNTKGYFTISYLVSQAGWYPKYDARVKSIDEPLQLHYKAEVHQNTGVDWKNVKLRFSNGNPNQSGVAPELQTWYLNYARNTLINRAKFDQISQNVRNVRGTIVADDGSPLPGVNIVVKGTTVGTVTDINGNYSLTLPNNASRLVISFIGMQTEEVPITSNTINLRMDPDVQQLSEVVSTGFRGKAAGVRIRNEGEQDIESNMMSTTTIENQTTVEFEVDEPYSIESNGKNLSVDLKQYDIATKYEYFAVPKLDNDAFLIARIINWDQYNLLEGEVNLYFEDAFVGRSILDARSLADTLNLSLGRDKSIVIGREKVDEFSKKKTIGSNKVETRGFKLMVRNKKSQTIDITLFDQIPVPIINDITVEAKELSNGKLTENTGEITWKLSVKSQDQVDLKLTYEVKYPKHEKLYLE